MAEDALPNRQNVHQNVRQLVDWGAAIWAGLVAGTLFLLMNAIILPQMVNVRPGFMFRYFASIVLGADVLPPPATITIPIFLVAILVNLVLALLFTFVLVIITHQWGFVVGVVGGALFGLALYFVNIYTLYFLVKA
ncbi:hypothetical protein KFU94_54490 [Chloroflexi bacterium TSY]|nr:hypothetical protein [Chloroflexi bacterium TSY]